MACFVELMKERQMMAQVTHEPELIRHLEEAPRTAYVGFDPTAESLHVGHLLPVLALRRWQQCGHRVVVLLGGGTAMVGDPTGKTEMRKVSNVEEIDARASRMVSQLSRLVDLSAPEKGVVVNNADWLRALEYLPFLREVGAHFSVNRMLTAECFKTRLEKGLSFLEFNYMVLQSYDFLHLYKKHDCTVQLGGDDQWSNMLGGMDLIRRTEGGKSFCFTVPLLVSSSGKKMGKTEAGAVWVDPEMTAPYDLFQYFRNIDDDMVEKCLLYFSDLPLQDVNRYSAMAGQDINEAKVRLAFEATKLIHGEAEATSAQDAASKVFSKGPDQGADIPEFTIDNSKVSGEKMGVLELLVLSKIAPSKSEARRWVQQGGLSIDGKKVEDIKSDLSVSELLRPEGVLVKKGKKRYYRLLISGS